MSDERKREVVGVGCSHRTLRQLPASTIARHRIGLPSRRRRPVGADPIDALAGELADEDYDEVISSVNRRAPSSAEYSLHPATGMSRWLRADLVSRTAADMSENLSMVVVISDKAERKRSRPNWTTCSPKGLTPGRYNEVLGLLRDVSREHIAGQKLSTSRPVHAAPEATRYVHR